MTEKEKMIQGILYNANYDESLIQERLVCSDLCYDYNMLRPSNVEGRDNLIRKILGKAGKNCTILQPFHCDYGYNIEVGDNFFANYNFVVLDAAKVTFGDNVFIAPGCGFHTASHPINKDQRNEGLETALPITVGNDVWIGAGVTVIPGVTIGSNVVIGAGSVVVKDIPDNSVAVGNPCHVIKTIE